MLQGKGFFIWQIPNCESGNTAAIASLAKSANLSHVLLKVANGVLSYNVDANSGIDYAKQLTQDLHQEGIQAIGWHYIYGNNPIGEANKAIQRIQQLGLDAYVIDAESEFKMDGKRTAARQFMTQLRASLPNFPVALCSYRFPAYHPEFPWREFLDKCDFNMPQVYWQSAHNAGEQLINCIHQFQALTPYRPIFPVGAAYRESGWQPTVGEVKDFMDTAKRLNLNGFAMWEWSEARSGIMPGIWEAVRDYNWYGGPTPKDICERYVAALNTHDPNQAVNMYTPTAVHITSNRTIQGTAAITAWYTSLFNQILPKASFTLTNFTGNDNSRHFTWTATSSAGKVQNGNDTFGLTGDQIGYHYSFFTVSS
jgi:hypothetical protein